MVYSNTVEGIFISRPNRFLAHVKVCDKEVICHVKNTGRCRELLIPGARVIVQFHPDAQALGRKTEWSLICVYKNIHGTDILINMDSQAPNQAAWEWLKDENPSVLTHGERFLSNIQREVTYGESRFDLAFQLDLKPCFMEVKGVTLEIAGTAMFPDAPTSRGSKHIHGLTEALMSGYGAYLLLVIQMKGISGFRPNEITDPAFSTALYYAKQKGVHILAYDCIVTPDSMKIDSEIPLLF